jgi:hypothetical protein
MRYNELLNEKLDSRLGILSYQVRFFPDNPEKSFTVDCVKKQSKFMYKKNFKGGVAMKRTNTIAINFEPYPYTYGGETLKSTTEYFLFHIYETIKSKDASWTTYAIPVGEAIVYIVTNGMRGERSIMEITVEDKSYRLITFLTYDDIVEVFNNANEFIKWCDTHGEVFLCERKRDVYKNLKGLSKQNKLLLQAKLIAYHQLWWNR